MSTSNALLHLNLISSEVKYLYFTDDYGLERTSYLMLINTGASI